MQAFILYYLLPGLTATCDVIEHMLRHLTADDARWDIRPEPERFSLREIVAHLAEWDMIFRERTELMRDEHEPQFTRYYPEELAREHRYFEANPNEQLRLFRERRHEFVQILRDLPVESWQRVGVGHFGSVTIQEHTLLIMGHDGYHTQQIVQWLQATEK